MRSIGGQRHASRSAEGRSPAWYRCPWLPRGGARGRPCAPRRDAGLGRDARSGPPGREARARLSRRRPALLVRRRLGRPDRLFDRACARAWRTRSRPSWVSRTCRSNGFRSPSTIALPRSSKARSTCCAVPLRSRWKDGRRCRFPYPSFPAASLRCSGRMRRRRCRMSFPAGRPPARSGVVRRRRSSRTRPSRSFPAPPGRSWLEKRLNDFQLTATVVPVDSYEAGTTKVLDGTSDVFFGDRSILVEAAAASPSASDLTMLDRLFTSEPIALGACARTTTTFAWSWIEPSAGNSRPRSFAICTRNGSGRRTRMSRASSVRARCRTDGHAGGMRVTTSSRAGRTVVQ